MFCNAESYTIENYAIENNRDSDKFTLAGNFRLLLGLTMIFAGLYIAALTSIQGHGLGFLLVFGSPFVILKDKE